MEEYMESELSGVFRVKLVTKNIVRGSRRTQFMHMRVKLILMTYFDVKLKTFNKKVTSYIILKGERLKEN